MPTGPVVKSGRACLGRWLFCGTGGLKTFVLGYNQRGRVHRILKFRNNCDGGRYASSSLILHEIRAPGRGIWGQIWMAEEVWERGIFYILDQNTLQG